MASTDAGSFVLELFHILFVVSALESMRRLDVVVRDADAGTLLVVWVRLDAEEVAVGCARDDDAVSGPEGELGPGGCGIDDCKEPA